MTPGSPVFEPTVPSGFFFICVLSFRSAELQIPQCIAVPVKAELTMYLRGCTSWQWAETGGARG